MLEYSISKFMRKTSAYSVEIHPYKDIKVIGDSEVTSRIFVEYIRSIEKYYSHFNMREYINSMWSDYIVSCRDSTSIDEVKEIPLATIN